MKNAISAIFLLFSPIFCVMSQYDVRCEYILNPERNIAYVRQNAEFWIRNAFDPEYGGFFSNVNRSGNVTTLTPQRQGYEKIPYKRKSFIVQSRHGYGFTRAFMLTGDEKYLDYAESALNFLYDYGWDTKNGGWYCVAKSNGVIDVTQNWAPDLNQKWSFQQHYGLVGIIAHYEATRNPKAEEFMNKGIRSLYENMWDDRPGYEGYYTYADLNWSNKREKGFTPIVDAITTNAELSFLVTHKPEYKDRLLELADIIMDRFISEMDNSSVKVLYPEIFSTDWSVNLNSSKIGSVGHFLKTAWCLGRAYLCDATRNEYKNAAIRILDEAWGYKNRGVSIWDHEYGGPFNEINILTGEWSGNKGNTKDYWTLEQGFTASMINYYITGNEIYLRMADESLSFFMNHFVDSVDGEIFYLLDKTGTEVLNGTKGDDYKGSYHSIETGYYAYLYSSLYYLKQPVNLYYRFSPETEIREITLNPLLMKDDDLAISEITLNGEPFTSFNPQERTLTIAPGQGGKFKVTFIPSELLSSVNAENANLLRVSLSRTTGQLYLDGLDGVNCIVIADMTGKVCVERKVTRSSINIDMTDYSTGAYMVICYTEAGRKSVYKIMK